MQKCEALANKIKDLRIARGLSQQQLAEQMFVSRSAVSMWELGTRLPDLNLLSRLAVCLQVQTHELLDGMLEEQEETLHILVAEDVPLLLRSSIRLIQEVVPQAHIIGFASGREALPYALSNRISVAFLDIELKGDMDGLELSRRLRDINPQINIIFLTAHEEYLPQAAYDHCSGYILKPLVRERVCHELNNLRFPVRGLNLE
ncbi:MAG: response regulator [Lachnospiraceae bacterium]|nr:response regulator [Lachnospiraceae bacterium]